jgi:hypothetical protein
MSFFEVYGKESLKLYLANKCKKCYKKEHAKEVREK